jgi:hypothetical protein
MPRHQPPIAANDDPLAQSRRRAEEAVLKLAQLIGRPMAREDFEKLRARAANDDCTKR